jgi:hypothetical protein
MGPFFPESEGQALHSEQILGMGHKDSKMAEFFEGFKSTVLAEKSLHRIVEPVIGQAFSPCYRLDGVPEVRRGNQKCIDVFGSRPGLEYKAHHGASREVGLATDAGCTEMGIKQRKEFADAFGGEYQTRSPRLESMKMLRRRNGTGDVVNRCALRLIHGTANLGSASGWMSEVHDGGSTFCLCAASSTMAAT